MSGGHEWELAAPVPVDDRQRSLLTSDAPLSSKREPSPPSPFHSTAGPLRVDFSQDEARAQRRNGFGSLVHYLGFDVVAEVEAQCRPLADEVRALMADGVMLRDLRNASLFGDGAGRAVEPLRDVAAIAAATHSLRLALVKILAGVSASVLPEGARERMAAVVRDAVHAKAPGVSVEDLQTGAWVDALAGHVAPLCADLAAAVGASPAGAVSALDAAISEALSMSDERGLDHQTKALERRFPELRSRRDRLLASRAWVSEQTEDTEQARVERSLRELRLP